MLEPEVNAMERAHSAHLVAKNVSEEMNKAFYATLAPFESLSVSRLLFSQARIRNILLN